MKVKSILAVVMLAVATTASAQFIEQGKNSSTAGSVEKSYSSVYAEYNMNTLSISGEGASASQSGWNGFSVGWNQGTNISEGTPLYLEYGLAFQYLSKSDKEDGVKESINLGTAKIPVNLAYRFALPNSKISITPYAGLNAKFHIWGNVKESYGSQSVSQSLFEGDESANRFQVGFQVGGKVDFGSAYVGISYSKDITSFESESNYKTTFGSTSITVGYNF